MTQKSTENCGIAPGFLKTFFDATKSLPGEPLRRANMKKSSPGAAARRRLTFSKDGICRISLEGLPQTFEIEALIEDYVANVELLPYPLKVILLDISQLVHLEARSRKVFSELLVQASRRYGSEVQLVIAGGPPMIRKYTEIFCRALKFNRDTLSFDTLEEALVCLGSKM